jgi:hypothetical protein
MKDDITARLARENAALPGSASVYRPTRDAEQVRDGEGRIWTVGLVRGRLSEAAEIIEKTTRRDGPAARTGFWPAIQREFGDLAHGGGEARETYAYERNKVRFVASSLELSRAEEAIAWPGRYLAAPEHAEPRQWLQLWMFCEATGVEWKAGVEIMLGRAGADDSLRTINRRRVTAFEIIMWGLIRDGIAP